MEEINEMKCPKSDFFPLITEWCESGKAILNETVLFYNVNNFSFFSGAAKFSGGGGIWLSPLEKLAGMPMLESCNYTPCLKKNCASVIL